MSFSSHSFSFVCRRVVPFYVLAFLLLTSCSSDILQNNERYEQGGLLTTPRASLPMISDQTAMANAPDIQYELMPEERVPFVPLTVEEAFVPQDVKIAFLVPLSGKNAALGQAMVNAAQLAVFDLAAKGFELMPRDTGTKPVQAIQAAKDALAAGARFVIGPLFAADVAAVRPVVHESSVSMLALSTDTSLAEPGAYVMGFAPAPQVVRVVAYAAEQGRRHFAALVPTNPYGELVAQAFENAVMNQGGEIVALEKVSNLAFLATKKDLIDTLLLPFGGTELYQVANQLKKAGFDTSKIKILGTGLWDEEEISTQQPFLVGGWYASAEPEARERFMSLYNETYGEMPPRLATLAYDATALAAVLAKSGRGFAPSALTNQVGFVGLDGVFRLKPEGQVERGLAIREITYTGGKTIDPAPTSFVGQ